MTQTSTDDAVASQPIERMLDLETERLASLALWCVDGIGSARHELLRVGFGGLRAAIDAGPEACAAQIGRPDLTAQMVATWPNERRFERLRRCLSTTGISAIHRGDDAYPTRLAELGEPEWLFVLGRPAALGLPLAGVVGTRSVGREGLELTGKVVDWCVQRGWNVVSGGALGVDGRAHSRAMALGARTVAVMPAGLLHLVPRRHKKLFEGVVEAGGSLVSEAPPWQKPLRHLFVRRNRLISGLSAFVVIVRAPQRSGALITADWARRQNRPVYAVPGAPTDRTARGCLDAIRRGAHLLTSPADLPASEALNERAAPGAGIDVSTPLRPPRGVGGRVARQILEALEPGPLSHEELVVRAGATASKVMQELTRLLLDGHLEAIGPGLVRKR